MPLFETYFPQKKKEVPKPPLVAANDAVFTSEEEQPQELRDRVTVESLEQALSAIKVTLLGRMGMRFSEQGETPLDFHGLQHSLAVGETTKVFLQKIYDIDPELIGTNDMILGEMEGVAHDLVQDGIREEGKNLKRKIGYNELTSAGELLEEMKRYRYADGSAVFPIGDEKFRQDIVDNIGTTIPEFALRELPDGGQGLRISQRNLTERSSLRALALASADLRGEFIRGKDFTSFCASGNAEFRELHIPVRESIEKGIDQISPQRRAEIAGQILDWKHAQVGFAKWQKILFQESIEKNEAIARSAKAQEIRETLADMFDGFDSSIKASEELSNHLEKEYGKLRSPEDEQQLMDVNDSAFQKLLEEMGYTI